MKKLFVFALFVFLPNFTNAQVFGPKTYEQCIDEVVKNSRTENATKLGVINCENKFPQVSELIDDCAVTWTGTEFKKGRPVNRKNYVQASIENTTHEIFFPSNMKSEVMNSIMLKHINNIKKICPF